MDAADDIGDVEHGVEFARCDLATAPTVDIELSVSRARRALARLQSVIESNVAELRRRSEVKRSQAAYATRVDAA